MTHRLDTGNGRVSFRADTTDGGGLRVTAGRGQVEVDCVTSASYIGAIITPDDARAAAHALLLAADAAEAAAVTR